jgi:hypothetical protein
VTPPIDYVAALLATLGQAATSRWMTPAQLRECAMRLFAHAPKETR